MKKTPIASDHLNDLYANPILNSDSSHSYMRQSIWIKTIIFTFLFDVDYIILWHT